MPQSNVVLALVVFIPIAVWFTLCVKLAPVDKLDRLASKTQLRKTQPTVVHDPSSQTIVKYLETDHSPTVSKTEEQASNVKASNINQDNPKDDEEKPLFLLHVGPSKTGTTTVQYFAQNNKELFEDANVYYLGHNGHDATQDTHRLHTYCLSGSNYNEEECNKRWRKIERLVDQHHAQNHIVMLSEERFSYPRDEELEEKNLWKHLVPLQEKWNVRVIYTYRRYYDWLPSKYYQVYNPKGGSRYESNLAKRIEWPSQKGKIIPSFPDYFEAYTNKLRVKHPASMKRKFQKRFKQMWYFNMHQGGDFLPNFLCQMVPEAPKLCDYLKTDYKSIVKNPSTSKHVHFDMLAVEAYKRGWLDQDLSRPNVAQAAEEYSVEMGHTQMTDFPLDCLSSQQTESLLNQSLALEQESVPKFFASPEGEAELRAGFQESLEKKKFCTVDVHAVLEDPKWQKFFKTMTPKSIAASPTD